MTDHTLNLSYREVLRVQYVRSLLLSMLLLRLAGRMFALAIVLYALTRTGSPVLAGWLAFAAVAPGLLISPIAGALIDRAGSVWAVTVDMLASTGLVVALILVDRVGWASPPLLLVLVGLFSLTSPLTTAGVRTLLPRLVPVSALDRANALDTALHGVTDICGPALAGVIIGFGGSELAFALIAALYAMAACCVRTIGGPRGRLPRLWPLLFEAAGAVVRVVRQPTLRGLALSYSLYEVSWGVLLVAVPVVAASNFPGGTGSAVAGLLWAIVGAVGGIAALIAGHLRIMGRERPVMALGMLVTALAAWPFSALFGLAGLAIGLMLVGAAAGPIDVGVLTLRQRRTDPKELGRVLSVSISLNMAGGPLGSALAGVMVTRSISTTFVVAAVASAMAAASVALIPAQDATE